MKSRLLIVCWSLTLALTACAKQDLTYKEALPKFRVGMTTSEVEKTFGAPLTKSDIPDRVSWIYVPEGGVPPGQREFSGFEVLFTGDIATKLQEVYVTAH